ncbi:MAG: flavodoxin family protein [Clostridiales bacterium]|nr:flavodoxin family protein [Clostridiales bacterium]
MKIGLIIFSRTGNTWTAAEKLRDKLAEAGHEVGLERITLDEASLKPGTPPDKIVLTSMPDPGKYEALVFGGPVEGFTISQVVKLYFTKIGPLQGKKTAVLITQAAPFAWIGGTKAVKQLLEMCASKGAVTVGSGLIGWAGGNREKRLEDTAVRIAGLFR